MLKSETIKEVDLSPRVLLNGFPKSGLHLAVPMVQAIALPAGEKAEWFGNIWGNAWTTRVLKAAGEVAPKLFEVFTRPYERYWPEKMRGPKGIYLKAHLAYDAEIERLLYGYGIVTVFIYRDLRDVVVSQARHTIDDRPSWVTEGDQLKHPGKALYREINEREGFEGVIVACIEGLDEYAGLFERWEMYAPWLSKDWVLPMTYEEMRVKPYNAAAKFIHHLERWEAKVHGMDWGRLSNEHFATTQRIMVKLMADPSNSPTFRKGKVGGWRKHFTPRVKEAFKAHDPGWLVALGYAKDENW